MNQVMDQRANRQVAIWLLIGVAMIMVQVMLGGITRLTESGLSITEWEPIKGVLPPLNETAWQAMFDKYKQTDQFKYIHSDFTLSDFKFIFFWEWFHRLWARLLGVVFLVGFVYFLLKKKFQSDMVLPLVILFLLGGLQGAIGWIMVQSGLVPEKYFVGHVKLTTHFIAALILLVYTFWLSLTLLIPKEQFLINKGMRNSSLAILLLLFLQLAYGGFMAGLKAAPFAPTWPRINGEWLPAAALSNSGGRNFTDNPIMVQFIHRGLAYLLFLLTLMWTMRAINVKAPSLFSSTRALPMLLVSLQVVLGILTVLNANSTQALIWLGVSHQFVAMVLLVSWIWVIYLVRPRP